MLLNHNNAHKRYQMYTFARVYKRYPVKMHTFVSVPRKNAYYAMLCYVIVILCYVMLCYVVLPRENAYIC